LDRHKLRLALMAICLFCTHQPEVQPVTDPKESFELRLTYGLIVGFLHETGQALISNRLLAGVFGIVLLKG
jgi:hypothetical protein